MNSARQQATHDDGTRHGGSAEPSARVQRVRGRPGGHAAAAGVVSVVGGVVLGELLAGVWSPSVSPLTAVGGAVIDAVPPAVKDWAVSLFGTADKAALLASMALVIAVLAALAGVVERRRRFAGLAVIAVFGLAGVAAVAGRAQATPVALALPVAAAAAAALILRLLMGRLKAWEAAPDGGQATARRTFLRNLAAGAALTAVGGVVAGSWRGTVLKVNDARARVVITPAAVPAPPIPAGAEAGVEGMQPLVTPVNDFYRIDTALVVPAVDPDAWVLKVTGMVQREVELTLAELLAKPLTERHITIACVSNPVGGDLIGNARWLGWPVRDLLALAGPARGADMVLSRSADGWTAGTPLEVLTDSRDALLAVGMNGGPLPLEHGFPVRLVVPGLYGYVSATKWVTELKVTTFAEDTAYWTTRGWSDHGPIKLSSRIDVPRSGRPVNAGTVTFGGIAWAQHTGVSAVELRVNRGSWQAAELSSGISTDTWYQWKLSMDLTPGQYEVQVRATDLAGTVQDEESRPVVPDGATGFHTVRVDVKS
ncbi:molybdopterin-dependent oxidoreductase [Pseudarthrobacter sp. SL88]|uniref:molybdopterin-dependent oxidoreductase n=1 Tax=Pseudarthrobacter sp. SL88 TaxID=2994666 RepID=UPI0022763A9F|nr:molybdopterin-dependent oxidoreductase [Pseudarthrobacter sp. SL88]MCY1675259.1 molybdopterin-dependent oxidoreductase [Pseudarthrobacter sp. SL88]